MNTRQQYKLAFTLSKLIWRECITNGKTEEYKCLRQVIKSNKFDTLVWLKADQSRNNQQEVIIPSLLQKRYRFNPEYNPIQVARLIKQAYIKDIKDKYQHKF